ncbi:vacuolar ATPase assembly integral membrane protein VMA21 homolog [Belonocnema kinseyi]|uniref:vacuolar ATPase assembly integral membrane protein VMA21 homolog n=1 Tax=Belonocnema kinseyi TaxID=2817044 RepID=UPI00143D90D6|nr:vacuolar ATPase assembly integral membrane protein VMA21 homolog [Belonocnema kinseyi]
MAELKIAFGRAFLYTDLGGILYVNTTESCYLSKRDVELYGTKSLELSEIQVFKTVIFHCIFIIALPVICFFTSKTFLFDGALGMDSVPSNVYAAGVTILVLHVALGAFIYKIYFDTEIKAQSKID